MPFTGSRKFILIHGYSGAVDIVGQKVADYLLKFRQEDKPQLDLDTRNRLKQRGYLTERTSEEEEEFVSLLAGAIHRCYAKSGARFLLIPTYNCQLRCSYCYELKLRTRAKDWLEKTMTRKTVDSAFQIMEKMQPSHKDGEPITLYGGEPLLAQNRNLLTYIVRHGVKLGYTFRCITNGVDLDNYLDLLGPDRINYLQITLDGPEDIHDKRRFSKDGGTFHKITNNIDSALRTRTKVFVRTNVDRENMKHIWRLARFYIDKGWAERKNFRAHCANVHSKDKVTLSGLELLQNLIQQAKVHPELRIFENDPGGIGQRFLSLIQTGGKYPLLHPAYCGSNYGMYILDPYGDVYLCWETVGTDSPHGKVGTYIPELSLNDSAISKWQSRTIANVLSCRKCPYALICGGGCGQMAYDSCGDLANPSCKEFIEHFRTVVPIILRKISSRKRAG